MSDDEIKTSILRWRDESPMIVEFWGGQQRRTARGWVPEFFGLEGAAVEAVLRPGVECRYRSIGFVKTGDALYCSLPSGRYLTYHRPRLTPSERRPGTWDMSYEGWNTNPNNGARGWVRMQTYGGRLCENVTQAVARDIQRHAIVAHERAGYLIVLHVYDENVAEVPEGFGSLAEFEKIMATPPAFAAGWPIRAEGGWRGRRYRKG